jgi:UDP-N-acetylmuramate dehydrogenase
VFPAADPGRAKLSAAWLIEAAGLKGLRRGDAGVSEQHALVLVNHGSASGAALLGLAREVAAAVEARFGIALEPEPLIIGARFREAA